MHADLKFPFNINLRKRHKLKNCFKRATLKHVVIAYDTMVISLCIFFITAE